MSKKYAVTTICNALVDILIDVEDKELDTHNLNKSIMHLVDDARQATMFDYFKNYEKFQELGGSGLNSTRALAMLEHRTAFIGCIANDEFGELINIKLTELKIDSYLKNCEQNSTGSCLILVTPDAERTMCTNLGASINYSKNEIVDEALNCEILHVNGYQWSTTQQIESVMMAIKKVKKNGGMISFDVADPFMVEQKKSEFCEIIKNHADIVFANKAEAMSLYSSTPLEAAKHIVKDGAIAVVKLGSKGAMICEGDNIDNIAAVTTDVVDTTAAGDMFAAGFLHGYLNKQNNSQSGKFAAKLASDVISRHGAKLSAKVINDLKLS